MKIESSSLKYSQYSISDISLQILLTLCMLGIFHVLTFFKINFFFRKILSETPSMNQTVWIQIRTDILLVLISVQTVWKGYKQTTKVTTGKERVANTSLNRNCAHKKYRQQ